MIWFVLVVLTYVGCGFLVYGRYKGVCRSYFEHFENIGYTVTNERTARILGLFGYFGLLYFHLVFLNTRYYPGDECIDRSVFCLRMPRELWAPRAVRVKQEKEE